MKKNNEKNNESRRVFLRTIGLTFAAILVSPWMKLYQSVAGTLVSSKDAMAIALGYVRDVKKAKPQPKLRKSKKDFCNNCQLYGDPTGKAPIAACALMPGIDVHAEDWCDRYIARVNPEKKTG